MSEFFTCRGWLVQYRPMEKEALIRKEYGRTQKLVLYGMLGFSFLWIGYALFWLYAKLKNVVGIEVAQAVLAISFVVVLFLVFVGIRLGHRMDRMIQQDRLPVHTVASARWFDFIIRMWKYERKYPAVKAVEPDANPLEVSVDTSSAEAISLLEELREYILAEERENPPSPPKPQKRRRGRRPNFPVGRWVPVALKWESRDSMRDDYSLGGVISDYLGTHPDGSPIMTEQAYRKTWRDLALEEAKRMVKSGEMTDLYQLKRFKKYYEKKASEA